MAMDMTPLRNKACIQSWNKTLVGGKYPWRLGSAKIAWLLYVIPVACSHFLKALAVSVDFLAVILDQDDQISVSVAKSNWLTLVKELTSIISMSSSSSWLVLATKTFLQRLQNLDPESPLMEKQYLWAAPSMIQKPIFIYKRLYGIGCSMPLGSTSWMPVWPVLMTWCTSTFMSWLMLAATLFIWELLMTQSVIQLVVDCKCVWNSLKLP